MNETVDPNMNGTTETVDAEVTEGVDTEINRGNDTDMSGMNETIVIRGSGSGSDASGLDDDMDEPTIATETCESKQNYRDNTLLICCMKKIKISG